MTSGRLMALKRGHELFACAIACFWLCVSPSHVLTFGGVVEGHTTSAVKSRKGVVEHDEPWSRRVPAKMYRSDLLPTRPVSPNSDAVVQPKALLPAGPGRSRPMVPTRPVSDQTCFRPD